MVIYERITGTDLIRAYSNDGFKIRSDETGFIYEEAIDPDFCNRTYTETEELVETLEPEEVLNVIFGTGMEEQDNG